MTYALAFDGTFEGWLCAVAEAARRGAPPVRLATAGAESQGSLFEAPEPVVADLARAARVERALRTRASAEAVRLLHHALHAEHADAPRALLAVALRLLRGEDGVLDDVCDPDVVLARRLDRVVCREVHRMHAFVRFEEVDGLLLAVVAPAADVLALVAPHFAGRLPTLRWAILDARRRRGLHHDGGRLWLVEGVPGEVLDAAERAARSSEALRAWRAYLRAVTIPERANPRLQRRHLPLRYHRYLPELRADG